MCNIWKASRDNKELKMSEWADLLSGPSFSELIELDITGGEPFLKEDLFSFFKTVASLKQWHLTHLQSIAIDLNSAALWDPSLVAVQRVSWPAGWQVFDSPWRQPLSRHLWQQRQGQITYNCTEGIMHTVNIVIKHTST